MEKIYTTKHCLTDGVKVYDWDGVIGNGGYVFAEVKNKEFFHFKLWRDAFIKKEDAIQNCEKRRIRKIESLKKQIARIENLNFNKD